MEKNMDDLVKEARREYYRKWRATNKDKVAQHNRSYWEKKAAALAAAKQQGENNDTGED